jgi:hypothetical protein
MLHSAALITQRPDLFQKFIREICGRVAGLSVGRRKGARADQVDLQASAWIARVDVLFHF